MLMTDRGAQRFFVQTAKELFAMYKETGREEFCGCYLSKIADGYVISNPLYTVRVNFAGKFETSKKK